MNRDDLKELAANPDFISGIYNYCDRWCERCNLNSRCFLYASEQADAGFDDPDVSDLTNAKFWRQLDSVFKDAHDLIKQCAEEAGVDLDAIESSEPDAHIEEVEDGSRNEFSALARDYAAMVETWFTNELVAEESLSENARLAAKNEGTKIDLQSAIEVIRWYQFFIAAKVFRAVMGDDDEMDGIYPNGGEDEMNPAQTDANGSAKIALIAIDRSFSAWRTMQSCVPDKKESIAPLMLTLENLRIGIEQTLPLARDFIRPGFDELGGDFVS